MWDRAEDRDAVQRVEIVAPLRVAEFDGEGGAIALGFDAGLDVIVQIAAGIGEIFDGPLDMPLDGQLRGKDIAIISLTKSHSATTPYSFFFQFILFFQPN